MDVDVQISVIIRGVKKSFDDRLDKIQVRQVVMAHRRRFFNCISTQLKLQLRAASVVHTKEFISSEFRNSSLISLVGLL
jgi:hypothetical protein